VTSQRASDSLAQISKWDRRCLWVSLNAQWSDVGFEAGERCDRLAHAVLALDERFGLLELSVGDMWTGSYRLFTNQGDDIDFAPYGWIFKLQPRLSSATARLASADYSTAELSEGATLIWWTGGTPVEFWTGDARQEQRRLLGDLFPERENWAIERMKLSEYRHHVLETDLTPRCRRSPLQ